MYISLPDLFHSASFSLDASTLLQMAEFHSLRGLVAFRSVQVSSVQSLSRVRLFAPHEFQHSNMFSSSGFMASVLHLDLQPILSLFLYTVQYTIYILLLIAFQFFQH